MTRFRRLVAVVVLGFPSMVAAQSGPESVAGMLRDFRDPATRAGAAERLLKIPDKSIAQLYAGLDENYMAAPGTEAIIPLLEKIHARIRAERKAADDALEAADAQALIQEYLTVGSRNPKWDQLVIMGIQSAASPGLKMEESFNAVMA